MKLFNFPKSFKYSAIALAVTGTLMGGYIYHSIPAIGEASAAASTAAASPATSRIPGVSLPDFAEIVAQQGPAVVNISVSGSVKTGFTGFPGLSQMDPNDPFYEFFRRFQAPAPQGNTPHTAWVPDSSSVQMGLS